MLTFSEIPGECIRVDLQDMGRMIEAAWWLPGYQQTDEHAGRWYYSKDDGVTLFQIATHLDLDRGFTVHIDRGGTRGRALVGQTTRIDILQVGQRWVVKKYPYGWTASTNPISAETKPVEFSPEVDALPWLEAKEWVILRWDDERAGKGYRAFADKVQPVRDARGTLAMRKRYPDTQLDLAIYF